MADLATLKSRIASELHRSDLASDIANAISDSIKFYQARRFAFNQVRAPFSTAAGTEFYSTLTDVGQIDSVILTVNSRKVPLEGWTYGEMEKISTTTSTQGQPWAYAWYAQQIRLYPVPDAIYTVTVSYLQKLPIPASDSDSNAWTDAAEALIRNAAKKRLCRDVTRDLDGAQAAQAAETEALQGLLNDAQQLSTGGLRANW